ncbi:hypothetical protein [Chondromyces apiculatus]|uniref:Uncharacterized protein n=1 Tax=Chondromyces apiculatus DSM 436 TaxID=1192034 RepID=A0A017T5B4_9BACT|nr:hypothetical protein [Chondromyces apiculatus]EYF04458.1 Hypothetical protein CAP_4426 [Chondromyces apiculatus DSM 436]
MPSLTHEALLLLFRNRPTLAAEMLREMFGVPVPPFTEARVEPAELTEILPAARHADLVILLLDGRPVLAIVVEAQLCRDPEKLFTWPAYVMAVRTHYRCRACLLVVTTDPAIARWSGRPIDLGPPDWTLRPYVLGPDSVPKIVVPREARKRPELAVLSVMAHGRSKDGLRMAISALTAAAGLDPSQQRLYMDVVLASLNEAAKRSLEAMMKSGYQYQSDFAKKYYKQGSVESGTHSVLTVLEARGLEIPEEVRTRVLASQDPDELTQWLRRAVVIEDVRALFSPSAPSS